MEHEEEEVQSLIPIQACGAFVTALEDEFMGKPWMIKICGYENIFSGS